MMARKKTAEELILNSEMSRANIEGPSASAKKGARQEAVLLPQYVESPKQGAVKRVVRALKRRPQLAAGVLAAVVVVAAIAFLVSRAMFANSTDAWDGTDDTSWYTPEITQMTITTAEQLGGMRKLCNDGVTFEGVSFRLGRNLDLNNIVTKPIGDGRSVDGKYNEFRGSFDGAEHVVSGLNVQEDRWDHAGLFGMASGGDIKNIAVEGKVTGQTRVGGVVGEMQGGSLVNCTNCCKVSSTKTATSYYPVTADVGGVCGIWLGIAPKNVTRAELRNLANEGDVSARACTAGGVIGTVANSNGFSLTVDNLVNDGSVTVYCESDDRDEAVGGVVGTIGSMGTDAVSNLVNNGEVACSTVLSVGGVVGALMPPQRDGSSGEGIELRKLSNTARVSANAQDERAHVGGIVGYLHDADVQFEDCQNTGELCATNGNSHDICAIDGAEVWDEWEDAHPATW